MALETEDKRRSIIGLLPLANGDIGARDRVALVTIMHRDLVQARWEDGIVIKQTERGTELTTAAIPPGDWLLMAKARDTSGNYSKNAAVVAIVVVSTFDVVFTKAEAPRWPGTREGFVKHDVSGSLIPDSTKLANEHSKAELFESFVPFPVMQGIYEAPECALGFDSQQLRIYGDLGGRLGPGVIEGVADPQLEVDHRLEAEEYDGFEPWQIGTVAAAFVKARVRVDFTTGVAKLTRFNFTLDAEERREKRTGVNVDAGGISVVFDQRFNLRPAVTVTPEGGLIPDKSGVSETGFDLVLRDSSGTATAGLADWTAIGV